MVITPLMGVAMRSRMQAPEIITYVVVVTMAVIVGIAAAAVPPWPIVRPTRDEATVWVTAFTGAGTLAAVAVALWLERFSCALSSCQGVAAVGEPAVRVVRCHCFHRRANRCHQFLLRPLRRP